jgi:hypothetical protein
MYILIDHKTKLAYVSACLTPIEGITKVSNSTIRRHIKRNKELNDTISDIKYINDRYEVMEGTKLTSGKGNNGRIKEINQARRDKGL